MKYMLDTNILIYLLKHRPPSVAQRINALPQQLNQLTQQVPVLYPIDARICQHYAEQFTRLKLAGTPSGANDLWIACHALAENATLVTHNIREFERVQELSVITWVE